MKPTKQSQTTTTSVASWAKFNRTKVGRTTLMLLLGIILFAASASAAPLVYVVTLTQQFGTVDLANGRFRAIGNGTPDPLANLVWWKNRLLTVVVAGPNIGSLAKINPATGEETVIGPTGLGLFIFDLAAVRGKLYATDLSNNIYSVDPDSGVATPITATGMPPDPNYPLTFNGDGSFNLCDEGLYGMGGKLYATFDSFAIDPHGTLPTREHEFVSPALYQIDPVTGAATFVAPTTWQLTAVVEADGKFYAFAGVIDGFDFTIGFPIGHAEVLRLDLATGKTIKITDVDQGPQGIFGAAPVRRR
jgi:hypothetical protein